ncbi:MAG: Gfo/Idh/MocA family oxidoreductase [Ruminococcaceae bacterium]|nr:Gfo/Idh/MocA family oxidoreductase [Oscillospiraceae bacterium]
MDKIKLGIIGFGNMGTGHTSNIMGGNCPEVELVAICDKNPDRCEFGKSKYPDANITYFTDAIEMLDSGLINACLVAVPHYDHAKYSMECMKRGIHVMCEKPAGVYTRQVREMIAESEKHPEVVFGMMFNQRTNPVYRKMHELVHSGKYGEIRRTNWLITNWYRSQAYYNSSDWRATWAGEGGGVLLNQCPHQLDLWQWICGMPVKVQSKIKYGKWHDIEVDDDVTTFVEYENGATGVFITTTGDGKGTNRFEVQMDGAKLVVEDDKLTVTEFEMKESEFTKTNTEVFGMVKTHNLEIEIESKNPQHIGVVNAWAGKILHGTPLIAEGAEGLKGVILSNAMHLSDFLGREVEIPFDEDLYYEELMKRVATSKKKENVTATFADTNGTYGSAKV